NKNDPNAKPFDEKKCEKDANDKLQGAGSGGLGDTSGMTSKMIYSGARNGNDYFQVYGLVRGDNDAMHKNAQKRVEMPAWGEATFQPDALVDQLEKPGFAEAEFYYDQVKSGKTSWDDYKDDALWNMRWRARLRRFRLPTLFDVGSVAGAAGGSAPAGAGALP